MKSLKGTRTAENLLKALPVRDKPGIAILITHRSQTKKVTSRSAMFS